MNDIDTILEAAGERWRASQRNPPEIDAAWLAAARHGSSPASMFLAGAVGAALVLVMGAAAMQLRIWPGVGGSPLVAPPLQSSQPGHSSTPSKSSTPSQSIAPSQPGHASAGPSAVGGQICDATRPIPVFVPPSQFLATPPTYYETDWFGSAALWTMLNHDGEVWKQSHLPHNPEGLTQKTFWWSADWPARAEPEPAITVVGTRLDGPGAFTYSPGTNATADFGTAMLVGVDFPSPGCWQLTGRYRDAVLSYVVWITED
jgi:hypothetical protein